MSGMTTAGSAVHFGRFLFFRRGTAGFFPGLFGGSRFFRRDRTGLSLFRGIRRFTFTDRTARFPLSRSFPEGHVHWPTRGPLPHSRKGKRLPGPAPFRERRKKAHPAGQTFAPPSSLPPVWPIQCGSQTADN